MKIARINFVGLPRSGKTCTLRRLMGAMKNILSAGYDKEVASTGVAERSQTILRRIQTLAGISKSMWSTPNICEEIGIIYELAHRGAHGSNQAMQSDMEDCASADLSSPAKSSQSTKSVSDYNHCPTRNMGALNKEQSSMDEILAYFKSNVGNMDLDKLESILDDFVYLINTDTGGQTEFLDMMSRFIMGPALNLIVSRLTDSLEDTYKIYCTNGEGESTKEEDSVVTLEDVIFQALASIASMEVSEACNDMFIVKNNDAIEIPGSSSKVMFVGTFKDKIKDDELLKKKNLLLEEKIKNTDFYRQNLVAFDPAGRLIIALDNLEGGQEEIDKMRGVVENIIQKSIKRVRIPISWLFLSLLFRVRDKKVLK